MKYTYRTGIKKIKTNLAYGLSTMVLVGMSLGGALPALFTKTAYAAGTDVVVSPTSHGTWSDVESQTGGAVSFVNDSAAPNGSALSLTTDATTYAKAHYQNYFATPVALSDVDNDLSYATKQNSAAFTAGDPAYQITVNVFGTSGYNNFTYEPYVDQGNAAVTNGVWQTWDVDAGKFYSSHSYDSTQTADGTTFVKSQGSSTYTLAQIRAAFPAARVTGVAVNVGSNNPSYDVEADSLKFNGTTYDFATAPSLNAENFNTVNDSSYKGVSVGFNAKDFGTVTGVTVDMLRTDGTHAVKHGTQDLFDLINANTSPYQFTAPFVIKAGGYDPSTDAYWTSDATTWDANTVPQSVTITVTGSNGPISVTNNNFSQGSPSWPNYADLVPTNAPTNLTAKFQYDSTNVANGDTLNKTSKPGNNNLELLWTAPAGDVTGYHILATYPDGSTHLGYQGPNTNAWLIYNGFGAQGNGKYTYQVVAVSSAGESSPSADFVIYYDTHSPVAQFTQAPADNSYLTGTFHVTATATDDSQLKSVGFDVRDGSGWKAGCVANTFAVTYSTDRKTATLSCDINTSGLTDGSAYFVRVHASDYAGYGSHDVAPLSVRNFTVDRTAPTATITSPSANEVVKGSGITIKGSANDSTAFSYFYCYVTLPGSSEVGVRGADCNTTWHSVTNGVLGTVDLTGLPDGNYEAHLVAYDKAGNHSDINYAVPFTLDNTAPTATITAYNGSDTTPTLTGTVSDPTANLTVKIDGGTAAPATNNGDGTWSFTVPTALTAGSHTVTLVVTDTAGNSYQTTANVSVVAPPASQTGINASANRGNSNNAPGHQATVTVTPNNDGQVLGASTVNTGEVKGASTTKPPTVNFANASDTQDTKTVSSNFLGLGWWWLPLVLIVLGLFWFFVGGRRQDNQA